jgi:hypothetical protein
VSLLCSSGFFGSLVGVDLVLFSGFVSAVVLLCFLLLSEFYFTVVVSTGVGIVWIVVWFLSGLCRAFGRGLSVLCCYLFWCYPDSENWLLDFGKIPE